MGTSLTAQRTAWLELRQIGDRNLSLMDHLFNRLDGMYPGKWRATFADTAAMQNWTEAWADAFNEEGITPDMVAEGLRVVRRTHGWPPSLPDFIAACRPSIDPEAAHAEAVREIRNRERNTDRWSHPAIYWTAMQFDTFDLQSKPYTHIRARWTAALDEQLRLREWPPIPKRLEALPAPGEATADPEKVRAILAGIAQKFRMQKA